jgi:hypothetical protein
MSAHETNEPPKPQAQDEDYVVVDNTERNRDPEDLIRYRGNWVAWSSDGRKVLVATPDPAKLFDLIDAAGLKPGEYILDAIDAEW